MEARTTAAPVEGDQFRFNVEKDLTLDTAKHFQEMMASLPVSASL